MYITGDGIEELSSADEQRIIETVVSKLMEQYPVDLHNYDIDLNSADDTACYTYYCDFTSTELSDVLSEIIMHLHNEIIDEFLDVDKMCQKWVGETDALKEFIDEALKVKPRPIYLESLKSVFECLINACKSYELSN